MDKDFIEAFRANFVDRDLREEPEGDYHDFLNNYINAMNQGAGEEDLSLLFDMVEPQAERFDRMAKHSRPEGKLYPSQEAKGLIGAFDSEFQKRINRR